MTSPVRQMKGSDGSKLSDTSCFTYSMIVLSFCILFLVIRQARFLSSGSIEEMVAYSSGLASRSFRTSHEGLDPVRRSKITGILKYLADKSAALAPPVGHQCHAQSSRKVFIRGRQYGEFSNCLISLAHGLGFVEFEYILFGTGSDIHYALVVPNYMARELRSFDLQVLLRHYCLVINEVPSAEELIDQEESFSISTLFSIKKSVAVKAAKLFAMLWKHFDYPASSLLRDTNVLAANQLRHRSPPLFPLHLPS